MMSDLPIYLDHHSTTPCDPRVVEAMLPYFTGDFGNAAAIVHEHGRRAAKALEDARMRVAELVRCRPSEISFTSGATESNNIAIRGVATTPGQHVVTTEVEHSSVLFTLEALAAEGIELTVLQPDRHGLVTPEQVRDAIRESTVLVSVMAANAEFGTLEPVAEIGAVCREAGVAFHTDATQAVGKIPFDLESVPCDLASMSAHKFYGPKGVGALYVREGMAVASPVTGGGQEHRHRSGTVNVAGAVGLATALAIAMEKREDESRRLLAMRNRLWDRLVAEIPGAVVNGPREARLPGNLHVSFEGVDIEALLHAMRRFSLSTGSACASGKKEPSRALRAIGLDPKLALSSLRFGLGRSNDESHLDLLVDDLKASISRLREISV
jgi:cysteine desulfurase